MFRTERPKWYLQRVKEKKNQTWTLLDFFKVYTWRVAPPSGKKTPVDDVRKELSNNGKRGDISKTAVYNLTRQSKAILSEKCAVCGNPLSDSDKITRKPNRHLFLCKKCKKKSMDLKRKIRGKYLKRGLCGVCGKNRAIPGRTSCHSCISSSQRRRNKKGLCGTCGRNSIASVSLGQCQSCLKESRIKAKFR